jgi:hypothetical protein
MAKKSIDKTDTLLWATTKYGPIKIPIYMGTKADLDGARGLTWWHHGKMEIWLYRGLLEKPKELDRTLLHEFVHVVEYLNDVAYLNPNTVDECTLLAQTMEEGLSQLLSNLKQVGVTRKKAAR